MNTHMYHDQPMDFGAAGQAATHVTVHGTPTQLDAVAVGIGRDWQVLTTLGPLPCEPDFGCHHLHLVIVGVFEPDDLQPILAAYGISSAAATAHLN